MLGPGPDEAGGPPYVHVHQFPEEPEDGPPPEYVPLSIERRGPREGTCRYCGQRLVLGKHGWRLDVNSSAGYACEAAPLGYHGVNKTAGRPDPQGEPVPGS
jgi:hypothetical protein